MKAYQKAYYAHVSTCPKCLPHIEQGRVNHFCFDGWELFKDAMQLMDAEYEGRAYPSQAWIDNLRQGYVEWLAGPDPNEVTF